MCLASKQVDRSRVQQSVTQQSRLQQSRAHHIEPRKQAKKGFKNNFSVGRLLAELTIIIGGYLKLNDEDRTRPLGLSAHRPPHIVIWF